MVILIEQGSEFLHGLQVTTAMGETVLDDVSDGNNGHADESLSDQKVVGKFLVRPPPPPALL